MLKRTITLLASTLAVAVLAASPVRAEGGWALADCTQEPRPGCELAAGEDGGPLPAPDRPAPPPSGGGSRGGSGAGGSDQDDPRQDTSLDDSGLADCAYTRSDYQLPNVAQPVGYRPGPAGPPQVARPALFDPATLVVSPVDTRPDEGPGAWYVWQCTTDGVRDALYRPPVWLPDAEPAAPGTAPDLDTLAALARNQLLLDGPRIATSPTADQLVRLPSWFWLDPADWQPASATAATAGISVTAVATPTMVTWTTGDGGEVQCAGPGTPFTPGTDPEAPSPDCGYTYQTVSEDQPGGTFTLTATVTWDVAWDGAGQTGTADDLTTVSTVRVRVVSVPALTTGGG